MSGAVMKSRAEKLPIALAARVAGEDLRVGDDVAVLNEIHELPSYFWEGCGVSEPGELVRVQVTPRDGGTPLKVQAVCLPFVFLKAPDGGPRQIDIRLVQLVRLDPDYARLVRKELRCRRWQRRGQFAE